MGEASISPKIHLYNFTLSFLIFSLIILLIPPPISQAATTVDSLPGYPGNLPFHLETGYVGVGEEEQVQLFYYFIESERDPKKDPLILWLTGGPGCSALSGLVLETDNTFVYSQCPANSYQGFTPKGCKGPLNFVSSAESWQSEIPKFKLNPYSWTKVASIIFVDSPVGTGFSYATTSEGYYSDDITATRHTYEFFKKWLQEHIEFQNNPIYVAGDSYSGITLPLVVNEILNGNKGAGTPLMDLKGYVLGNPYTDKKEDEARSKYKYARRISLLSDELYEATRANCHGNYETVSAGKLRCHQNLHSVSKALDPLFPNHILEPTCNTSIPPKWCRDGDYWLFYLWANNLKVQEALHIREGTTIHWSRCNKTLAYTKNVLSSFDYHLKFANISIHALTYSGDQDIVVPYVGTLAWIRKLNISVIDRWRPWFVKRQVAGYTTRYSNGRYHLTFATVKGAGHTAPEYKRRECLDLLTKWIQET